MPNNLNCRGWCPPAVIYLTLALVSTAISLVTSHYHDDRYYQGQNKVLYTISHLVGIAIWTSLLYWLCSNCHITAAWMILLLPLILTFFFVIAVFSGGIGGKLVSDRQQGSLTRRVYYN